MQELMRRFRNRVGTDLNGENGVKEPTKREAAMPHKRKVDMAWREALSIIDNLVISQKATQCEREAWTVLRGKIHTWAAKEGPEEKTVLWDMRSVTVKGKKGEGDDQA